MRMISVSTTDLDQAGFYKMFKSTKITVAGMGNFRYRKTPLGKLKILVTPFTFWAEKILGPITYRPYMKARKRVKHLIKFERTK